jgi:hypothetical protein
MDASNCSQKQAQVSMSPEKGSNLIGGNLTECVTDTAGAEAEEESVGVSVRQWLWQASSRFLS